MRARSTAFSFAAGVAIIASVTACTSSDSGSSQSDAATQSSAPRTPGTSSAPLDPSSHAASSGSTSAAPSSPASTAPAPSTSRPAPAGPTAKDFLLRPDDLGGAYKTTTQVDATIPSLCGGKPADALKPYVTTAQIGFFDATQRILITEKITTYDDEITASQVNSVLLNVAACGSAAKFNGLKATYSEVRNLSQAVRDEVDASGAVVVTTAKAHVVFAAERNGLNVAQLTILSMGPAAPRQALVDKVTTKAADRLHN